MENERNEREEKKTENYSLRQQQKYYPSASSYLVAAVSGFILRPSPNDKKKETKKKKRIKQEISCVAPVQKKNINFNFLCDKEIEFSWFLFRFQKQTSEVNWIGFIWEY